MSLDRRDVLAGLACAGALGAAEWLRPRQPVVLMPPGGKLTDLVPAKLGSWVQGGGGDIVVPRTEGSLASRLYGDQLARFYVSPRQGAPAMMLSIAYGDQQSDTLQLHRPEACYPALGFTVEPSRPLDIAGPVGPIPAVALTARARGRIEDIVYWSRLGIRFPRSEAEQRRMRFSNALDGIIPDGALVRASAVRTDLNVPVFQAVEGFLRDLAQALGPDGRRVLLARD
jgi:EpsI family protein